MTSLRTGKPRNRFSIPDRDKRLSFVHSIQTGPEVHSAPYPIGTMGFFPSGELTMVINLTTDFDLAPSLRTRRTVLPLRHSSWCHGCLLIAGKLYLFYTLGISLCLFLIQSTRREEREVVYLNTLSFSTIRPTGIVLVWDEVGVWRIRGKILTGNIRYAPRKICPSALSSLTNPTRTYLGSSLGFRVVKPEFGLQDLKACIPQNRQYLVIFFWSLRKYEVTLLYCACLNQGLRY